MREQFQVNLRGIVEILSHHLYSSPRVYLRELIQNGRDAITARRHLDADAPASIEIRFADDALVVRDSGIGLSADEMRGLLATIGASSKRADFAATRNDFLGQFGIGLLSCFLIADEIEVRSRSAKTPHAATERWVGYADGTFTVASSSEPLPEPGTEVRLRARRAERDWTSAVRVRALAAEFARYLDVPVHVEDETGARELVSQQTPPWRMPREDAEAFCRRQFGFAPLDVIDLDFEVLGFSGVAFVLGTQGRLGDRAGDTVYARGMLLSTRNDQLVPPWAYFVRIVADSGPLAPTASREALQENALLGDVKQAIGRRIRDHIGDMARSDPARFEAFCRTHATGLRALAVSDDEMLDFVCRHLRVESTAGHLPIDTLLEQYDRLNFVRSVAEYRALAELTQAQGMLLVNGGYVYEAEILGKVRDRRPGSRIAELDLLEVIDLLPEPAPGDRALVERIERVWSQLPVSADVRLRLKAFSPVATPSLYAPGRAVMPADDPLAGILGEFAATPEDVPEQLVLNLLSPPVRALGAALRGDVARDSIRALHGLGLLLAGRELTSDDAAGLSQSLHTLIVAAAQPTGESTPQEDRPS